MTEARRKFYKSIAEVEGGEHIIVLRRGVPVCQIRPLLKQARTAEVPKMLAVATNL